jgi:hypothetical protein
MPLLRPAVRLTHKATFELASPHAKTGRSFMFNFDCVFEKADKVRADSAHG